MARSVRFLSQALAFGLLLGLLAAWPPAGAQEQRPPPVNPLRPSDTSSPRATLESFLTATDRLLADWRNGLPVEDLYLWTRAAADTLDLSETADGGSWEEQVRRILLLRAILNRVPIPPLSSIPDQAEADARDLASWTLPGTRITIERIGGDRRGSEYLFSADSVADLEVTFRRARLLPLKIGRSADFEKLILRAGPPSDRGEAVRDRLSGLEATDPRATLEGFMEAMNEAYAIIAAAQEGLSAEPPTITKRQGLAMEARAAALLQRAADALDLSQIPKAQREDVAVESALQLKEILDRLQLPPIGYVPDAERVQATRVPGQAYRWNIPGTEIEIAEVMEGPQAGEFLFSPETIERLEDEYEDLNGLPYRTDNDVGISAEYSSPETSPGFYDAYISTPGHLVPAATIFGDVIDDLPQSLKTLYFGQTVWQWVGLLLTLLAAALISVLLIAGLARLARGLSPAGRYWLLTLAPALVAGVAMVGFGFVHGDLNITGRVLLVLRAVTYGTVLLLLAWFAWRLLRAVAETVISSPGISDRGIDASLIRIAAGLLAISISGWIVVHGLGELGVDIVPLLAGLGVGGLAAALAIRPTLENLIGGLILYVDKPVRVGDFCTFGAMTGTVENIGVRSTQIRGLDRTLISIPNAKFADMEIVNWAHCDRMLIQTTIGLRYETKPDQLRYVLVRIREMLHAHPKIDRDTVRVRFAGYAESSLTVAIRVYALTREWNEFHAIREDVFFRIAEIVEASGSAIAFPSQTLYMGRDAGLDGDRTAASEAEVAAWRQRNDLPFPALRSERIDELQDSLDYPPKGSPGAPVSPATEEKLSTEEPDGKPPAEHR